METVKLKGKIIFDPKDKTKKHISQSGWKIVAMIIFNCDISEYYAWFVRQRFNIELNKPIRGPHISFINDRLVDVNGKDNNEKMRNWEALKKKWNGKEIEVVLNVDTRTNGKHWWVNVPEENREIIHSIRDEIGIGRPHFGLHMSLGYANPKYLEHSEYIHELLKKGFIKT